MPGPGPNPPWQKTVYDNGAVSWLNEQPANEPPVTDRILYIEAANKTHLAINLETGASEGW
jgi:hypothetical protein